MSSWWLELSQIIVIRGRIAQLILERAKRLSFSVEEFLVELLNQYSDPSERVRSYIETALDLLEQAKEELEKGNLRQAAEKLWGATALAVKAYACWREGRRITSHGELWEYSEKLAREIGEWVYDSWNAGTSMHTCFYEGWCTRGHVEEAYKRVEKLVKEILSKIRREGKT